MTTINKHKIALTTGDIKGIGKEISLKALNALDLKASDVLIIGEKISDKFETIEIDKTDNGKFCFEAIIKACELANEGKIGAIVTSPVSKYVLNQAGYSFSGQTEILEKYLSQNESQKAEMLFIAKDLRVMLLTRHVAVKDIELSDEIIINKTLILNKFLKEKMGINAPKIALCALNPHCGENGLMGDEEEKILTPAVEKLREIGINITNPMSADGLFSKVGKKYLNDEKQDYDCILACYHDQGLCPLKAIAFDKAVNTTIGLKIIRTSPSSGVAYDIAGKNIADCESMKEAIKLALRFSAVK